MTLLFTETGGLIFGPSALALDLDCCCEVTCCSFIGRTLYGRICMTACPCGTGFPGFVEIDYTLTYSSANSRWEGTFTVPGCGTSMSVRITHAEVFDPAYECHYFWSDDGCGGDWSTPTEVNGTFCNPECDPYLWVVTRPTGGDGERYRCLCPGGTWPPGEGPVIVGYGFCRSEDRTCDP